MGAIFLFAAFLAQSAQQQAALAGIACACALIPYVLFRLHSVAVEHDRLDQILLLLRQSNSPATDLMQGSGAPDGTQGPAVPKTWMS